MEHSSLIALFICAQASKLGAWLLMDIRVKNPLKYPFCLSKLKNASHLITCGTPDEVSEHGFADCGSADEDSEHGFAGCGTASEDSEHSFARCAGHSGRSAGLSHRAPPPPMAPNTVSLCAPLPPGTRGALPQ